MGKVQLQVPFGRSAGHSGRQSYGTCEGEKIWDVPGKNRWNNGRYNFVKWHKFGMYIYVPGKSWWYFHKRQHFGRSLKKAQQHGDLSQTSGRFPLGFTTKRGIQWDIYIYMIYHHNYDIWGGPCWSRNWVCPLCHLNFESSIQRFWAVTVGAFRKLVWYGWNNTLW